MSAVLGCELWTAKSNTKMKVLQEKRLIIVFFLHKFVVVCYFRSSFRSEMKAMVGSSAKQVPWREPSQRHTSKYLAIMVQIS